MPISVDKGIFTRVEAARQVLRDKAEEIIREYLDIAAQAKAAGDYMTAAKSLQWLIEHMPRDGKNSSGIVDRSVDKDSEPSGAASAAPAIRIGIALGGVEQKQITGATNATKSDAIVHVATIPGHDVQELKKVVG